MKKQLTKQQKIDLSSLGTGVHVEITKMKKEGVLNDPLRVASLLFYLELCATAIFKNRGGV